MTTDLTTPTAAPAGEPPAAVVIPDPVRAFLDEHRFATLATIDPDGTPQLTVMWYLLRGDTILFNTKLGRRKQGNIDRDRRVALCVEDGYRYVSVNGTVRAVVDQSIAHADIRALTARYHPAGIVDAYYDRNFRDEERVSYYLTIERLRASGLGK
jgi:PPOX class probable F420-dependent enzyme